MVVNGWAAEGGRSPPRPGPPESSPGFREFHVAPFTITPTLRANPYPEVTDLFCRLPLSTLFYQLEAVNLGDLLRLSVRLGMRANPSCGFSRTVVGAPDSPKAALPVTKPHLWINHPGS